MRYPTLEMVLAAQSPALQKAIERHPQVAQDMTALFCDWDDWSRIFWAAYRMGASPASLIDPVIAVVNKKLYCFPNNRKLDADGWAQAIEKEARNEQADQLDREFQSDEPSTIQ